MEIEFSGLPALGPGPMVPLSLEEFVLPPAAPEFEVFGHEVNQQHAAAADPIQSQAQVIRVTVTDIANQIKFCFHNLLSAVRVIPSIIRGHPLEDFELMVNTHKQAVHQLRQLEQVMELEPGAETIHDNPVPLPTPDDTGELRGRAKRIELEEERIDREERRAELVRPAVITTLPSPARQLPRAERE